MDLPDWLPVALFERALRRSLGAGETLFLREDRPLGLYLLESGEIRLTRSDPEGREMTLFKAQPGETFAEASLFSEMYHCDAVASVPSVVHLLPRSAALEVFSSEPDIAQAFMATLARQVMTLRTRLENRNLRTARARVLHYLGLQAHGTDGVVRVNSNLKSMASELGLSHESLYRTLAALEVEGAIERGHGEIRLTNLSV
ncbi:MAG: Crp/Fnr family transcriptional regulator [Pseudomonadota bacterium]|jgi:CRP-like cAMP-binding protein|nr:Crp/Fnr family transcriptional regulator [Pseudomonadota bacterium]